MPIEAVKEIVMTVTRRARMGSAVEDAFEKMQAPQEQGGIDPAQVQQAKQQYEQHIQQLTQQLQQAQQQAQSEQAKIQADMQAEQIKAQTTSQVEQFKAQQEMMLAEQQLAFDRWKAELEAQTKIQIAQIQADGQNVAREDSIFNELKSGIDAIGKQILGVGMGGMVEPTNTPVEPQPIVVNVAVDAKNDVNKSITFKRDKDGNIISAEASGQTQ